MRGRATEEWVSAHSSVYSVTTPCRATPRRPRRPPSSGGGLGLRTQITESRPSANGSSMTRRTRHTTSGRLFTNRPPALIVLPVSLSGHRVCAPVRRLRAAAVRYLGEPDADDVDDVDLAVVLVIEAAS